MQRRLQQPLPRLSLVTSLPFKPGSLAGLAPTVSGQQGSGPLGWLVRRLQVLWGAGRGALLVGTVLTHIVGVQSRWKLQAGILSLLQGSIGHSIRHGQTQSPRRRAGRCPFNGRNAEPRGQGHRGKRSDAQINRETSCPLSAINALWILGAFRIRNRKCKMSP